MNGVRYKKQRPFDLTTAPAHLREPGNSDTIPRNRRSAWFAGGHRRRGRPIMASDPPAPPAPTATLHNVRSRGGAVTGAFRRTAEPVPEPTRRRGQVPPRSAVAYPGRSAHNCQRSTVRKQATMSGRPRVARPGPAGSHDGRRPRPNHRLHRDKPIGGTDIRLRPIGERLGFAPRGPERCDEH
jgi:hypothetical protein